MHFNCMYIGSAVLPVDIVHLQHGAHGGYAPLAVPMTRRYL